MSDHCCSEDSYSVAQVGHPAPEFSGEAYLKGKFTKVDSKDYKGKWVWLMFYPLDFTFVCPTEIIEASKHHAEFKKLNAEVVFASVDSVHSHKAWSKELGDLEYPMLSDLTKDVALDYGVLHDDGMALRGSFLIDPDGVLRAATIHDLAVGRSVDEMLRVTDAFQSGELCPVGWKKGDKTLGKA